MNTKAIKAYKTLNFFCLHFLLRCHLILILLLNWNTFKSQQISSFLNGFLVFCLRKLLFYRKNLHRMQNKELLKSRKKLWNLLHVFEGNFDLQFYIKTVYQMSPVKCSSKMVENTLKMQLNQKAFHNLQAHLAY